MITQQLQIGIGVCAIISLVVILMPKSIAAFLGNTFSLGKKGMRYSRFYRDDRDSLGSLMMFIGVLYSILFIFLPYSIEKYTFSILYIALFVLVILQYYRVYGNLPVLKRLTTSSAICFMASANYIAAMGFLNGFGFVSPCAEFGINILNENIYNLTYFLAYDHFICFIANMLLYFFSFYYLIAQFKYLRLEDWVKARNGFFLWFKVLVVSAFMLAFSYYSYIVILFIFNIG